MEYRKSTAAAELTHGSGICQGLFAPFSCHWVFRKLVVMLKADAEISRRASMPVELSESTLTTMETIT
jgi:hypothetical protein